MSFITRFSLDANRLTLLFLAAVIVLGLQQFLTFPRQEDPPIVIREIVVTAAFPGMEAEDMEELITRRIETELRTLPELDDIWSESRNGLSVVHADTRDEFHDLDSIWQRVRNRMSDVKPDLPAGTLGPFVNDEFGLTAVATIALWSEGFSMADMRVVARNVRDRLYELPGIRKAELHGVHREHVYLKFSALRLSQFGITAGEIINALVEQNIVLPGGRVGAAEQDVIVMPTGNFRDVEDIEDVEITIPGTRQTIQLSDVLTVERDYADPPSELAYFNGERAIVISVSITPGVNSVAFGRQLTEKIEALQAQLPIGYVMEFATFQPDLVEAAVNGGLANVYQTIGIVLVVVVLFLGVRTGLIVGSFVPMTMLLGLIVMRQLGLELERVSIASSIIALGMLVDNGIVIAEEIRSRLERGQDRREACIETGRTLSVPLLTSSLTTILAFMPMLLIDGQVGEYAFSLPMVVIVLLLSSWFLSMYVTPAMCFWFMKVEPATRTVTDEKEGDVEDPGQNAGDATYSGRIYRIYRNLLERMLRMRVVVLGCAVAAIVLGVVVVSLLVREFFGPSDRNQFLVYLDLPAGYQIASTDATVQRLTAWLSDDAVNPEITSTVAYVGTGGPRFFLVLSPVTPAPHVAFLVVNTETSDQVKPVIERLRGHLRDQFPEAAGRVKQMWLGAEEPGLVEIRLFGPDSETLLETGDRLVAALQALPGTRDVRSDWENEVPKARILVDQVRARRAGISSRDVALSLQSHMDGLEITEYREGDLAIPVVVRSVGDERTSFGDLWDVKVVSSQTGDLVPLTQIADIRTDFGFYRISRRNQERSLSVEVKHETLKAPELLEAALPLIEDLQLGPEYRWEVGGEIENSEETLGKIKGWMPVCIFGIVALLIWQFNSFRRPLIIFITIPLAFTGAFLGLVVMGAPFDFFAMLGLLSLAGVIINNGIVLIDKFDTELAKGGDRYAAIVGAAISRFRPIVMTTITTVLGLMPLILSADPLFLSMAVVIAFGLIFGTVLTLGVVPVLYSVFFGIKAAR